MLTARLISLLFLVYLFSETVVAQTPPLQLVSITQARLTNPSFATNANDGTGRMFILEQAGLISSVPRGSTTSSVFLDLTDRVITGTERGLLGLAFHPAFAENRRFFVDYTRRSDGAIVVAEYHASALNGNLADQQETIILTIPHPNAEHNGGMLAFGPDGFLYISVGDGGNANDPSNNAQNVDTLLGKILRIDIDEPGPATPYSSPPSNPFYGPAAGRDEIYAFGFRNPWRFSFDPVTGELYVGDVGQDAVEEIDVVESGGNYGWRVFEGFQCTRLGPAPCIPENYIAGIHNYVHTGPGGRCSITGGYVYRGNKQTLPFGAYIFGDYCTGEILMFYHGEEKLLLDTAKQITSFGVDEDGELYVVGGTVDRIVNTGPPVTPAKMFTMAPGGGVSFNTADPADQVRYPHAEINPNDEDSKPAALAFIELRNNGVLVSEAAVPATSLLSSGRFYAEVGPFVDTGVAVANPDMARSANVAFVFTDAAGNDFGSGSFTLPPGGQLATYIDQGPFFSAQELNGSVTFSASIPVSVVALRGMVNERSEFLTTTMPVADLDSIGAVPVIVPQLAAGGGWTTDLILLNVTDNPMSGTVQSLSSAGENQAVTFDGSILSAAAYEIPARSSRKLRLSGGDSILVGSLLVSPDVGQAAPSVGMVYAYASGGITVSATGSAAIQTATRLDIYAEVAGALGAIGSVQTGVAIANPAPVPVDVSFELYGLDGSFSGITGQVTLPAHGQRVSFIRELPGAAGLVTPFQGVLRLSSPSPVAALAIRGRYNERREFLLSTTPPADPAQNTGAAMFIPQVVDGDGNTTQIVIYDLERNGPLSGSIYFFDQAGQPISPGLH